jgi:hypothetical protein
MLMHPCGGAAGYKRQPVYQICASHILLSFYFMEDDQYSLFEYEPDPDRSYAPDRFNFTHLNRVVCEHLGQPCQLRKLGEGSFHKVASFRCIEHRSLTLRKVYDILSPRGPQAVVRVACPCMARDKIESEVSTPFCLHLPLPG